jgi:hypothetical protein
MPFQSVAYTLMELTVALATAANATYDNPNGLSVTLTGPTTVVAGQIVELGLRIDAESSDGIAALGAAVSVPNGWTFEGLGSTTAGTAPDVRPQMGGGSPLDFAWIMAPSQFPYAFTFRVKTATPLDDALVEAYAAYRKETGPERVSNPVVLNLLAPDTTPPLIVLKGAEIVVLEVGNPYEDPGYVATDDVDGDITEQVVVDNLPDPSVLGDYVVAYNVRDAAGNAAIEKTRLVQVVPEGTTAKGFFLCGAGTGESPGFGDLAAVMLVAVVVFLLAGRRRATVPAPVRVERTPEYKR